MLAIPSTYISVGFFLDKSLPLNPRRINTSPVHCITAYANAKARPDIAKEAYNGSPSLRQALTSTEMQTMDNKPSEDVSVELKPCILSTALHTSWYAIMRRCCWLASNGIFVTAGRNAPRQARSAGAQRQANQRWPRSKGKGPSSRTNKMRSSCLIQANIQGLFQRITFMLTPTARSDRSSARLMNSLLHT